jgi:predicted HTH domain antitoxin
MPDTLTVSFDEDVLLVTSMTRQEFVANTKFTMAAKLWMDGKITAGQAAKLCGMGKVEFLYELPKHGYPMSNLGADDLEDELAFVRMERSRDK